ncbi:hypothetical protein F5Y19DRAFT_469383 [Xylariaceae sp. FL1651]|nr:hypothetical protein F5Y19DRAFT_469383 [Xylariaceae sp. FL1651]
MAETLASASLEHIVFVSRTASKVDSVLTFIHSGFRSAVLALSPRPGSNLDTKLGTHLTMEDYNSIFEINKRNTGLEFVFDEARFKTFEQIGATPFTAALDLNIKPPGHLQNSQIVEPA